MHWPDRIAREGGVFSAFIDLFYLYPCTAHYCVHKVTPILYFLSFVPDFASPAVSINSYLAHGFAHDSQNGTDKWLNT